MRIPAPIVAVVTAGLLLLLVSALPQGDSAVPSWAAPHPRSIVSYHATVTAATGSWGTSSPLVAALPSRMVITDVVVIPDDHNLRAVGQVLVNGFVVASAGGGHSVADPLALRSGVPVAAGARLDVRAKSISSTGGLVYLTVSGYRW